jgi:hypothetical protein
MVDVNPEVGNFGGVFDFMARALHSGRRAIGLFARIGIELRNRAESLSKVQS